MDARHHWDLAYFVDIQHRGKGIAGEAAHGLVGWAVDTLGVTGFWASADPDNKASRAILEGLGMQMIAEVPPEEVPYTGIKGEPRGRVIYYHAALAKNNISG